MLLAEVSAHPKRANMNPRNNKLPMLVVSPAKYAIIPPNKSNRIGVKSEIAYVALYAIENILSSVYIRHMRICFFYQIILKPKKIVASNPRSNIPPSATTLSSFENSAPIPPIVSAMMGVMSDAS